MGFTLIAQVAINPSISVLYLDTINGVNYVQYLITDYFKETTAGAEGIIVL